MKLWYKIWMYVGSEFKNNNITKYPPHIYIFEIAWVEIYL